MESPPSLSSILDDETDNQDEEVVLKGLFKVRCTLSGDALVKFDLLMDSLNEMDESIEELESHMKDEKRRFNLLRQELKHLDSMIKSNLLWSTCRIAVSLGCIVAVTTRLTTSRLDFQA
jgi:hypothetical protein